MGDGVEHGDPLRRVRIAAGTRERPEGAALVGEVWSRE